MLSRTTWLSSHRYVSHRNPHKSPTTSIVFPCSMIRFLSMAQSCVNFKLNFRRNLQETGKLHNSYDLIFLFPWAFTNSESVFKSDTFISKVRTYLGHFEPHWAAHSFQQLNCFLLPLFQHRICEVRCNKDPAWVMTPSFTREGSDEAQGNTFRAMVEPPYLEEFKKYVNTPLEDTI